MTDEMTMAEAVEDLESRSGSQIVSDEHAQNIADAFGVELQESAGQLQPIKELDRFQPDNDKFGIGVGSLCYILAKKLDMDAEDGYAVGHGRCQRERKENNLQKLAELADD
jgi:hypothetical protein